MAASRDAAALGAKPVRVFSVTPPVVTKSVRCIGCGGLVPDITGPTHEYMESSPGCWQAFGDVLGREYIDPAFGAMLRLTADTFAVQHPGRSSSRNAIQSVCGHLLSLCLILEKGTSFSVGERGIRWVIERKSQFTWLTPPNSLGEITVVDVGGWESAGKHGQQVRAWAESAWSAWAAHHDTVRVWASSVLKE